MVLEAASAEFMTVGAFSTAGAGTLTLNEPEEGKCVTESDEPTITFPGGTCEVPADASPVSPLTPGIIAAIVIIPLVRCSMLSTRVCAQNGVDPGFAVFCFVFFLLTCAQY